MADTNAMSKSTRNPPTIRADARLKRSTFQTSRLLDFCSEKELVAQTGHQPADWPLVIVKELLDNAIDACEEAGIAPQITVTVDEVGIAVRDNGTGIPAKTIKGVLDFTSRTSSREAYVSPTRGAQGNALKTIVAMPFVLDGESGTTVIMAKGKRHTIAFAADQIRQEPVIHHDVAEADDCTGTEIRVHWPVCASSKLRRARSRFLQIADDYTWLNPHLTLTVNWFGATTTTAATDPSWSKWKPSDPTSPWWYDDERLARLIAAYITHDGRREIPRTVREFVTEFRGLSGTAKQKAVLGETRFARMALTDFVIAGRVDLALTSKLLGAMQANSNPVKPALLGIIGQEHFRKRFEALGCEMDSFDYRKIADTTEEGIPCLVETAFAWRGEEAQPERTHKPNRAARRPEDDLDEDDLDEDDLDDDADEEIDEDVDDDRGDEREDETDIAKRRLITGVNWSPGIINPFRSLGAFGMSLDTILSRQRADRDEPVIFVLHVACPRVEYTDRGKSAVVVRS